MSQGMDLLNLSNSLCMFSKSVAIYSLFIVLLCLTLFLTQVIYEGFGHQWKLDGKSVAYLGSGSSIST